MGMRWQEKEQTEAENIRLVFQQTCFGKRYGLVLFDHITAMSRVSVRRECLEFSTDVKIQYLGIATPGFIIGQIFSFTQMSTQHSGVLPRLFNRFTGAARRHRHSLGFVAESSVPRPDNRPRQPTPRSRLLFSTTKADGRIKIPLQFGLGWLRGWAYGVIMPAF